MCRAGSPTALKQIYRSFFFVILTWYLSTWYLSRRTDPFHPPCVQTKDFSGRAPMADHPTAFLGTPSHAPHTPSMALPSASLLPAPTWAILTTLLVGRSQHTPAGAYLTASYPMCAATFLDWYMSHSFFSKSNCIHVLTGFCNKKWLQSKIV